MRALTLKEIKTDLVLEERNPLEPSTGEVIVKLKAASLNRRDFWITQGMYPGIDPPVVLGSDGAGVVSAIGDGVDGSWLDREVIINPGMDWGNNEDAQAKDFHILGLPTDGTFADEVEVAVDQIHEKPSHLNWHEAAALPLAGMTAYRALFSKGNLQSGHNVLITGIGGGVATFALQFAVAAKANVFVTSSSETKIARAIELGATAGFDYTQTDWLKQVPREAAPELIIDSAGGAGYQSLVTLAAPGGRIVNYGAGTGSPENLDMFKVFWKQLQLLGTTMGSPADFANMLELVNQHKIKPVIDQVFKLEEVNDALAQMKQSPQFGKYVLKING